MAAPTLSLGIGGLHALPSLRQPPTFPWPDSTRRFRWRFSATRSALCGIPIGQAVAQVGAWQIPTSQTLVGWWPSSAQSLVEPGTNWRPRSGAAVRLDTTSAVHRTTCRIRR